MSEPTTPGQNSGQNSGANSGQEPGEALQRERGRASDRETTPPAGSTRTVGARWWVIPALTFLVGLVLGGVVIGALRPVTPGAAADLSPSASATPTGQGSTGARLPATATVVVPAECLEVAGDSQNLVELTQQAAAAARDLDASRLSEIVRQIDTAQSTLRGHADACRAVKGSLDAGSTPSITTSTTSATETATPTTPQLPSQGTPSG
ncbi:MAG: hypothetical protein ABI336_03490 [Humibacillus sp.]